MMTGENVIQQIEEGKFWSFTPEAELKNGRLAIIALFGLSAM
jgi:hypothetical protein|tara:strand:+ start:1311 stop:1436 length:126 start_codon:yes stop_codon:yes gene_type:complete